MVGPLQKHGGQVVQVRRLPSLEVTRVTLAESHEWLTPIIGPGPWISSKKLHRRQGKMYAGGPVDPVVKLLPPDIVWHVLGSSAISGSHRGLAQVIDYFERRRSLANATMQMRPGEVIFEGDALAQFVMGSAVLGGEKSRGGQSGSLALTSIIVGFGRHGSLPLKATCLIGSGALDPRTSSEGDLPHGKSLLGS